MHEEIIIRFLLAALWGGLVGLEREYRSKSAGFRTMIMISIGACFFTMMSAVIGAENNPDRIASNIVTGIGFLGAGVIFRGDNRVNGITTAATIWAVAAVGMGIGTGHYFEAGCASLLILIVLALLPYVEDYVDRWNHSRTYIITCNYSPTAVSNYENVLKQSGLRYKLVSEVKNNSDLTLTWMVQGSDKKHRKFIADAMGDSTVRRFEY